MNISDTRREFVKRAAYIAPAILTLAAAPSYAKSGSDKQPKDPKTWDNRNDLPNVA